MFRPVAGTVLLLGAVGQLQFEVVAHRLEHEYGCKARIQPARYSIARWVTCDDGRRRRDASCSASSTATRTAWRTTRWTRRTCCSSTRRELRGDREQLAEDQVPRAARARRAGVSKSSSRRVEAGGADARGAHRHRVAQPRYRRHAVLPAPACGIAHASRPSAAQGRSRRCLASSDHAAARAGKRKPRRAAERHAARSVRSAGASRCQPSGVPCRYSAIITCTNASGRHAGPCREPHRAALQRWRQLADRRGCSLYSSKSKREP